MRKFTLNGIGCQKRYYSSVINFPETEKFQNEVSCNMKSAIPFKNVPGPKPLPVVGNNWRFIPYIGGYEIERLDKLAQNLNQEYGNIVKMDGLLGRPDMLFLFDPDEIEKVFRQEDYLPLRPSVRSVSYYKRVHKKEFFQDNAGVIAVHGQEWQNFRSKVNQVMLQPRVAKMYIKSIEQTASEFVSRIGTLKNEDNDVPADFLNEIHKWSLESIARIALDVRLGCLDVNAEHDTQRLINAVNTVFATVPILELKFPFWRFFSTPTFRKYINALDTINSITITHVNNALENLHKRKKHEEPSLLQRLLEMEGNTKTSIILALDLFLVGIDTTSHAVASVLYQLALNPKKQEKLRQEINQYLPNEESHLTSNKLDSLTYLKACIREVMRMYPVIILNGRQLSSDCIIGGYHVPKGVQVIFHHYAISNLDKYFPKSNQFIPERWLKDCPYETEVGRNHHPFASVPYGYGKRMCLGRRFADLEIQTVVAKILQKYKVEYHHEKLEYRVHPTYGPSGPLKLRFVNY